MSQYRSDNPLVVQSDKTLLLEVDNPRYEEARDAIARFAELEKSPEYVHTYRITPLSLWNAAASGLKAGEIAAVLAEYGKFPVPQNLVQDIQDYVARYGRLQLVREGDELLLTSDDPLLITQVSRHKQVQPLVQGWKTDRQLAIKPLERGRLKQALLKLGYPPEDLAGYVAGSPLDISLKTRLPGGQSFGLRPYQREAVEAFWAGGSARGGSGVIVLPCGAGKTVIGLGIMAEAGCHTLIMATNITAVHQWMREIVEKTGIPAELVGEYTGAAKDIRPVTVTTYQILTYRRRKDGEYPHFALFNSGDWGLIIYDEVHLLPAPVFRITAEIQARRRLGLTATLVREDGKEDEVFSLIGPKKYDLPWKQLENQGWIASAACHELRVDLPAGLRQEYALAEARDQYRLAAENPRKDHLVLQLVMRHRGERVLVIGQYLDQLERLAQRLHAPLITGKTPQREREQLFSAFQAGSASVLVVSKVANFSVDLPEAAVAIQVSGAFGSRQEEAQRLGRILRPKENGGMAHFYTLVSHETSEQEFAAHRQLFLTEQGYRYSIQQLSEETVPATAHPGR